MQSQKFTWFMKINNFKLQRWHLFCRYPNCWWIEMSFPSETHQQGNHLVTKEKTLSIHLEMCLGYVFMKPNFSIDTPTHYPWVDSSARILAQFSKSNISDMKLQMLHKVLILRMKCGEWRYILEVSYCSFIIIYVKHTVAFCSLGSQWRRIKGIFGAGILRAGR